MNTPLSKDHLAIVQRVLADPDTKTLHVHKIREDESPGDECECGQLLCPDTGNPVGYDTTGEYWHLDGSTCFIHQTFRIPEAPPYRTVQEPEPEDLFDMLLDIAVKAGFEPTDECDGPLEWIKDRYQGYRLSGTCEESLIYGFNTTDDELNLHLLSFNGVQHAQATFTYNQLGLDMFAAVVKELP